MDCAISLQIVAFGAVVAAASAGFLHGHGAAVSSQNIVRHDSGYGAAPVAYAAAPVAHAVQYAPAAHYAAPAAYSEGHDYYVSSARKSCLHPLQKIIEKGTTMVVISGSP